MTGHLKPSTRAILELLTAAGTDGLTPMDALREAACFRLAARVSELRAAGHDIATLWETDGDGTRFARYVLTIPTTPEPYRGVQEALLI